MINPQQKVTFYEISFAGKLAYTFDRRVLSDPESARIVAFAHPEELKPIARQIFVATEKSGPPLTTDRTRLPQVDSTDLAASAHQGGESGHPIRHEFTLRAPTSTCIVCHVHPGTNVVNAYLGYTWWDNETDGQFLYPAHQKYPTSAEELEVNQHNPEGAAPRGLWSNLYPADQSIAGQVAGKNFLENVSHLNPQLKHTQFADFHGHGWIFRAVYKQSRSGVLMDSNDQPATQTDAAALGRAVRFQSLSSQERPPNGDPVHLKDIHLERGMHCADCHFTADVHGDGNLYGETRAATAIKCESCHGTVQTDPTLLSQLSKPDISARFFMDTDKRLRMDVLAQTRAVEKGQPWHPLAINNAARMSPAALYAHTIQRNNHDYGIVTSSNLAHPADKVSCYACHTSWNTSCFGCHLPMKANWQKRNLHNEATFSRNYTNYNFQTLRDDVYMLGIDSTAGGHKVVPVRSACAVLVSSQDANRQWLYTQQQTVSAEGFAGTSFSPYFPHTVRTTETKQCSDCHLSNSGDNNAIMAQLLLQGANSVNFIGRFAYVGEGDGGLEAVAVTEREEPQAVIGSRLHELAYPDYFRKHVNNASRLHEAYGHDGHVLDLQLRGEYLYAACGEDGFIAYDVANIDNKGFSERIVTAPVSPLGQRLYVKTSYATSICSPSTMAIDPTRRHLPENQEQGIHKLYAYLYLTDRDEGLVVIGNPPPGDAEHPVGVATLLDGNPENNFLSRAREAYNPHGQLKGARHMALCGYYAYIACDAGVAIVDLNDPLDPRLIRIIRMHGARRVAIQFRYAFVLDDHGLNVLDITDPTYPQPKGIGINISDARDVYICRTYGYVAAGRNGLLIVDLEKPEKPSVQQIFNAGGSLNDATAVRVGMTNASMFAYVADGKNGLRVIQLTSPDDTPGYLGFSPRPTPRLIATYPTHYPAIALSKGLDRDRAVDEMGNQLAVFGRKGARPMNLREQRNLYLNEATGKPWYVVDKPTWPPLAPATQPATSATTKPSSPANEDIFNN